MRPPAPWSRLVGLLLFSAGALLFGRALYEQIEWQRYLQAFSAPRLHSDSATVSGWTGDQRLMIPADRRAESYEWIAQAQQTLQTGPTLASVNYDNAPTGRPTRLAAPYRTWLASGGTVLGWLTGTSAAHGVEKMALGGDAFALLLVASWLFWRLGRRLGFVAGAAASLGWFFLYPLQNYFLPGQPRSESLALLLGGAAVLPLMAGSWGLISGVGAAILAGLAVWTHGGIAASWGVVTLPGLAVAWFFAAPESTTRTGKYPLVVLLAGVLGGGGIAFAQSKWGGGLDLWLCVNLAALAAAPTLLRVIVNQAALWRWSALALVMIFWIPGMWRSAAGGPARDGSFSAADATALVERDLAFWLAARTEGESAVVLAPASLSQSLWFNGGLKVIVTPNADNEEGFKAAVRLSGASSADEAKALFESRGLTHVVLPTWDGELFSLAKLGSPEPEKGFLSLLIRWLPPRWLRPVPYQLPQMGGWEDQSVAVFEVVEMQDNVAALAHLADYFLQMGRRNEAVAVARSLAESFPEELLSILAQAQVARALKDTAKWQHLWELMKPQLEAGNDESLEWSDRVTLGLLLAEARVGEFGKTRLEAVLQSPSDGLLRKLGPVTGFRLLRMTRLLKLNWGDVAQRDRFEQTLPAEFRDQLSSLRVP